MKLLFLIFFFVFFSNIVLANKIDQLKTIEEVNTFVKKEILKDDTEENVLNEKKPTPSGFGKNKFYKLDLDNDGLTDLVIDGNYLFAIRHAGNNLYETHAIDRGAFSLNKYTIVNLSSKDNKPLLVIRRFIVDLDSEDIETGKVGGRKTERKLTFKFGSFVEYNSKPDDLKIREVHFETAGCFGTCPVFEMKISQDKKAIYKAIQYNVKKGVFKTTLDNRSFDKIVNTINYINIRELKKKYRVPWTDDQTSILEIKYNNGKVRRISDYGMISTFGLANLYAQFFNLRKSQNWTKPLT